MCAVVEYTSRNKLVLLRFNLVREDTRCRGKVPFSNLVVGKQFQLQAKSPIEPHSGRPWGVNKAVITHSNE